MNTAELFPADHFINLLSPLPREGNGTPLQYSCLENPTDGGAWKAAVHGVTEGLSHLPPGATQGEGADPGRTHSPTRVFNSIK